MDEITKGVNVDREKEDPSTMPWEMPVISGENEEESVRKLRVGENQIGLETKCKQCFRKEGVMSCQMLPRFLVK